MGMPAPPVRDPKMSPKRTLQMDPTRAQEELQRTPKTVIQVWSKTGSQKGDHFGRVDSEILNNSLSFSQDQAFQKRFTLGLHFRPLFGSKVFPQGSSMAPQK